MKLSRVIVAALFAAGLGGAALGLGGAASAGPRMPSPADILQPDTAAEFVKRKGHKGWKGHKGRHYGWYRGRHRGWYKTHRRVYYAPRRHGLYKHHRRPRVIYFRF
jgi:hypothetical protein